MVDYLISDNVLALIFAIFLFESCIILGWIINYLASNPKYKIIFITKYFHSKDYALFLVYLGLLIFILWYLFCQVLPLVQQVQSKINKEGVDSNIPYISLSFAFLAFTATMLFTIINWMTGLLSRVETRHQYDTIIDQLKKK